MALSSRKGKVSHKILKKNIHFIVSSEVRKRVGGGKRSATSALITFIFSFFLEMKLWIFGSLLTYLYLVVREAINAE